ncbi:glycosyltransferase involved in cell wall biosynthesis [Pedobacter psychrotolerans]|uniref:Glycosyltransferase involved in cell wall biosynthesis n=1 Tax=Pedobacter psychrotolerans TaxID=1843235 RepID=A0A4R2HL61_9SPHI|nr:glycosyltransferase family 2 protein [Pedobacter psychrotolerans]TCO30800.1 glycosyltransferase involved in cell wall biosynthesis [Pedobacter psychrotolerans]GGE44347.1 hypothetical protein GCM10011413_08070 [Pedobacter psychrotolerans]
MILSVVIPCYNHGQYIQDAIDSVLSYKDQPIEIIIVDDGSTDIYTINKMMELKSLGYHVIQQKNSGLAKSRNIGIMQAKGKYILPLDADNKIREDYIRKALPLLEANKCDIVYAKPFFFGDDIKSREFETKSFSGPELLLGNYIDACAIYRKEIWIKNEGYDYNMPFQGFEDWEFWINSYLKDFRFHFIEEELYEYRILENSMISDISIIGKFDDTFRFLLKKHGTNIVNALVDANVINQIYWNDRRHPFRSSIKYLYIGLKKILGFEKDS